MSGGHLVIAIDGPAAGGKGTLARKLAARFGLPHLDTGSLYRAVGRDVLDRGGDPAKAEDAASAARALDPATLADPRLREEAVGAAASKVAVHPDVRAALMAFQRAFAAKPPGAVLDGRDIGTVICPDAAVKLWVTAGAETRALRRTLELGLAPDGPEYRAILDEIRTRDARDANRTSAPLKPAEDAIPLDTSELDAEATFRLAERLILERIGR